MSTRILDHIVHLTPPGSLKRTVEEWRKLGFNVSPGGVHADGLTENALVLLSDGVYIELISFTHDVDYYPPGSAERTAREKHAWASKAPGWIDYAFLGFGTSNPPPPPTSGENKRGDEVDADTDVELADLINDRAASQGASTKYEKSVSGGRERTDGEVLKWRITAPDKDRHGRGVLPFFCGDVTGRELRVPADEYSTQHTNTARGVAEVRVAVPRAVYAEIEKQVTSVVGVDEKAQSQWELTTYVANKTIPRPTLILEALDLDSEGSDIDETSAGFQVGGGINEVVFWADSGSREDKTPYGKIVWRIL